MGYEARGAVEFGVGGVVHAGEVGGCVGVGGVAGGVGAGGEGGGGGGLGSCRHCGCEEGGEGEGEEVEGWAVVGKGGGHVEGGRWVAQRETREVVVGGGLMTR